MRQELTASNFALEKDNFPQEYLFQGKAARFQGERAVVSRRRIADSSPQKEKKSGVRTPLYFQISLP